MISYKNSNTLESGDVGSTKPITNNNIYAHGLISEMNRLEKENTIQRYARESEILNELIKKSTTPYTDPAGNRITNATRSNIWFSRNVAFIFSIGFIFSEIDRAKLNEILQIFQQTDETGKIASARTDSQSFLLNAFKVLNYNDDFIKSLEERMEIGNGNYHICLIPIVTAKDEKVLALAPEECYKFAGPVDKYCEWDAVFKYISSVVAKYGLLTDFVQAEDNIQTHMYQTPPSANFVITSDTVNADTVHIHPENDPDYIGTRIQNPVIRFDECKVLNTTGMKLEESFRTVMHNTTGNRRGKSINVHINRDGTPIEKINLMQNPNAVGGKNSLQARIYRDHQKDLAEKKYQFDTRLGIETRDNMNRNLAQGSPQYIEYKIYKDDSMYDEKTGRNKLYVMNESARTVLPNMNVERSVKRRKVKVNLPKQKFTVEQTHSFSGSVVDSVRRKKASIRRD